MVNRIRTFLISSFVSECFGGSIPYTPRLTHLVGDLKTSDVWTATSAEDHDFATQDTAARAGGPGESLVVKNLPRFGGIWSVGGRLIGSVSIVECAEALEPV